MQQTDRQRDRQTDRHQLNKAIGNKLDWPYILIMVMHWALGVRKKRSTEKTASEKTSKTCLARLLFFCTIELEHLSYSIHMAIVNSQV